MTPVALILAAGEGTRMESTVPKVLHELAGRPLIRWVIQGVAEAIEGRPYVVLQPGADAVREEIGETAELILQREPRGTGHAVAQAREVLEGRFDLVLVTYSDMPLIGAETYEGLISTQRENPGPLTMLTVQRDSSRGFGRVLRDQEGQVAGVIEEADASPQELEIREFNVGAYCFDAAWLWRALPELEVSGSGEYYLTDLIAMAVSQGEVVGSVSVADPEEGIGINDRVHLSEAEAIVQRRINREWMSRGVTMQDPDATYISPEVELGRDVLILANTHLQGATRVGSGTRIGPNTIIRDCRIGSGCSLESSFAQGAILEDDVSVGPFARLREGAHLQAGSYVGNFGEIKNSTLGPGAKAGHFCYLGDAEIGPGVNIGAGTITANYDGEKKHQTVIDQEAFIGSDTMLIAPVRIGRGARTGAGSVVTRDVPPYSIAVGVPARVIRKLEKADE